MCDLPNQIIKTVFHTYYCMVRIFILPKILPAKILSTVLPSYVAYVHTYLAIAVNLECPIPYHIKEIDNIHLYVLSNNQLLHMQVHALTNVNLLLLYTIALCGNHVNYVNKNSSLSNACKFNFRIKLLQQLYTLVIMPLVVLQSCYY